MNKKYLGLLLFFVLQMITCRGFSSEFIIGYYPSWNRDLFPAKKLDLDRLTHVMHAFAWPTADGALAHDAELIYPELNQKVHSAGRAILLSVGGWGHGDGFAPMTADSTTRRRFIDELFTFVLAHQYDGVDFDWEFPASAAERKNMVLLIKELRQEFDKLMRPQALLITMAVSEGFLYLNQKRSIPADKIVIGIPFYGREFNASRLYGPSSGSEASFAYKEIVEFPDAEWFYHWDQIAKAPYLTHISGKKLVSYDDTLSVRLKAEYAIAQKLAGVMIWALGQDDMSDRQPLLEAVARPFQRNVRIGRITQTNPSSLTVFPNPFNHVATLSFDLQVPEPVNISLYDCQGRQVIHQRLEVYPVGCFNIPLDCAHLPAGVYIAEVQTLKNRDYCKLTLLK